MIDPDDLAARLDRPSSTSGSPRRTRAGAGYPGSAGPSAGAHVYVPADSVRRRRAARGAGGAGAGRRARRTFADLSATTTSSGGRGPSWPPSRSRTCGSTSRTATSAAGDAEEDGRRPSGSARALAESQQAGTAPPSPGSGSSRSRGRPAPRDQDADALRRDPGRARRRPGRLRGDPAQGDQRRPGRGMVHAARRSRTSWGWPQPSVRGPGRDAAVDPRSRRHRAGRPDGPCVRGPADRTALRHLRLFGVLRHRGRAAVARAPGGRPRQAGHAGGRRRHRRPALRRLHQRAAGRRRGRRAGRVGKPPPAGRGHWSAASTRAGTSTPPSCRRGTPRRTASSAAGSPGRWTGSRDYAEPRQGASRRAGDRPGAGRLRTSRAGLRAVDAARCASAAASRTQNCDGWRAASPTTSAWMPGRARTGTARTGLQPRRGRRRSP